MGWVNIPYFSYIGLASLKRCKLNNIAIILIILLFLDIAIHSFEGVQKEYWLIFFSLLPYTISYLKLDRIAIKGVLTGTIICLIYYSIELVLRIKYMYSGNIILNDTYADYKFGSIAGQDTNFTALYLYSILINILFLKEKINKKLYQIIIIYVGILIASTMSRAIMVGSVLTLVWYYRKSFNISYTIILALITLPVIAIFLKDDGSLMSKFEILINSVKSAEVLNSFSGLFGDYRETSTELAGANYTGHTIAYLALNKLSVFYSSILLIILLMNKKNRIYNIIFIIIGFSLFPFMFVSHSISMLLIRSNYRNV